MSVQLDGAGTPESRHEADPGAASRPWVMLILATVGFAVNFWAWALLSPLGPQLKDSLHLSTVQQSLVVAVPVVVGSLGRIPVGALTDRFGGRVMFPLVSACTIVPVLFLGLAGHSSLAALLIGGFFLGIGGTAFAVGVPFVNAWFPPQRRGYGRHRDQRAHDGEAGVGQRHGGPVPADRGGPGRLRGAGFCAAAGRAGPRDTVRAAGPAAGVHGPAGHH